MTSEARRTLDFLASLPMGNSTVEKEDLHDILMIIGGSILCRGSLREIQTKHLGAGVYKIWTTPFNHGGN